MPKQKSPFEPQHHESCVVDLQRHFFLVTYITKCIHIDDISAKLCTKTIAHSKSCNTHTLLVTVLSLVKEAVRVESSGNCSTETLIFVPQICEEQQVKP